MTEDLVELSRYFTTIFEDTSVSVNMYTGAGLYVNITSNQYQIVIGNPDIADKFIVFANGMKTINRTYNDTISYIMSKFSEGILHEK